MQSLSGRLYGIGITRREWRAAADTGVDSHVAAQRALCLDYNDLFQQANDGVNCRVAGTAHFAIRSSDSPVAILANAF